MPPPAVPVLEDNIFAGIDLKKYNLNTKLPDDLDARSTITSRSLKELKMKKKDKKKLRHELWIRSMWWHVFVFSCLCQSFVLKF